MSILQAIRSGLGRAVSSPKLVLMLWGIGFLYALPASLMMRHALLDSFGDSLVARDMLATFDLGWHAEHEARTGAFEETLGPTVSGPGPVLDNLEAWWSGKLFGLYPGLVGLGIGYAVLWAFLLGGVVDHLRRPEVELDRERFFAASGRFFPSFLGLALVSGFVYFAIFKLAARCYRWIEASSRDVTEERTVLGWILLAVAIVVVALSLVRMLFDYAKISAVVDQRRGVLGNLAAAATFVWRRPVQTVALYGLLSLCGVALLAAYAWLAPGANQATAPAIVLAFVFGQLYLIARLILRLGLLAAQASLFSAGIRL